MNRENVVWAFIVGIPSVVLGLLPLAFPDIVIWVIGGMVAFWLACIVTWLALRIRSLESQIANTRAAQRTEEPPGWDNLETIDLFLDGWKASQIFELDKDDKIRVTSSGPKRFVLHLAVDVTAKKFKSIRKTSETKNWTGTWDIESGGNYAIAVEPVGNSPFWVKVRVDRKSNRFHVHVGKTNY